MKYFTIEELCVTSRKDLQEYPDKLTMNNLEWMTLNVLDKAREVCGPLVVTSGFRSAALNRAAGGSETSQHLIGEAVDLIPQHCTAGELLNACLLLKLPIYQFILYPLEANPNRVHIGVAKMALNNPAHLPDVKVCNGKKQYVTYTGWLKTNGGKHG